MLRTLVFMLALLLPQMASATCNGTDLRARLTADQTTELDALMRDMPYPDGNHWVAHKGDQTIHLIASGGRRAGRRDRIRRHAAGRSNRS